jgi:hypothetical protein
MTADQVSIPAGDLHLPGELTLPTSPRGIIMFVQAGAASRFSPRSRALAKRFQDAGLGTLLVDIVTPAEEAADRAILPAKVDLDKLTARDRCDRVAATRCAVGRLRAGAVRAWTLCGCRSRRGGAPSRTCQRDRLRRRPSRSGDGDASQGALGDAADRRRARPAIGGVQSPRVCLSPLRAPSGSDRRSVAAICGEGSARARRRTGHQLAARSLAGARHRRGVTGGNSAPVARHRSIRRPV